MQSYLNKIEKRNLFGFLVINTLREADEVITLKFDNKYDDNNQNAGCTPVWDCFTNTGTELESAKIRLHEKRADYATLAHELFQAFDALTNTQKYITDDNNGNAGLSEIEGRAEAFERMIRTNSWRAVSPFESRSYL